MTVSVSQQMQNGFKEFATGMKWIQQEAKDIEKAYFATDASTVIGALVSGSDGASLATKMTKTQYTNGITFCQQLKNLFDDAVVTQGDYLGTIDNLLYGNAASPAEVSGAAEDIANRMNVLAASCLTHFFMAKDLSDMYDNSELGILVAGLTSGRVIYGASMNNGELTSGINLVLQYKKLINNEAVTKGLYSATVAVWDLL